MTALVPALGLGLVAFVEILDVARSENVDVVEIEPQTLWELVGGPEGWHYAPNVALIDALTAIDKPTILHGIGHPFGGTVRDPVEYSSLLRSMADRVNACWVSEHLSFNRVHDHNAIHETGFLMPPRQSPAGARVAASRIQEFRAALGRPTAFELGVNYLRPEHDALDDGEFFATIAEQADAGILLDLHNLWCNERNGRRTVREVLDRLPLERVWELHLAGGMELDGFTLDAHSGRVPDEVVTLAAEIIPRLPQLGAIIYEILPEHLPVLGVDGVGGELERLRPLWSLAPRSCDRTDSLPSPAIETQNREVIAIVQVDDLEETSAWERSLDRAVRGTGLLDPRFLALTDDPGTALLHRLVCEFRASSLTRALRYSMIAMLASLGTVRMEEVLHDYFTYQPPVSYHAVECHHFTTYLLDRDDIIVAVPYLAEVLSFERALVEATLFEASTTILWSVDPTVLLEALDSGVLPAELPKQSVAMVVG